MCIFIYSKMLLIFVIFLMIFNVCSELQNEQEQQERQKQEQMKHEVFRSIAKFRDCFGKTNLIICLKEKALIAINDTIFSDIPIKIYNIEIERNLNYKFNYSEVDDVLTKQSNDKSIQLNKAIHKKIEEFFKSRLVKFSMSPEFDEEEEEGRGKKHHHHHKSKGHHGMALGVIGCMIAQMVMGKIAFMAGTALIMSKLALALSMTQQLKKQYSGDTQHVVYASAGDYGHAPGGWRRHFEKEIPKSFPNKIYSNNGNDGAF